MIKIYLIILLIIPSMALSEEMFKTDTYQIKIKPHCKLSNIDCSKVSFELYDLNKKDRTTHVGEIMRTKCDDGTRCKLFGYYFNFNGYRYIIYPHRKELQIRAFKKGEKAIYERGEFEKNS